MPRWGKRICPISTWWSGRRNRGGATSAPVSRSPARRRTRRQAQASRTCCRSTHRQTIRTGRPRCTCRRRSTRPRSSRRKAPHPFRRRRNPPPRSPPRRTRRRVPFRRFPRFRSLLRHRQRSRPCRRSGLPGRGWRTWRRRCRRWTIRMGQRRSKCTLCRARRSRHRSRARRRRRAGWAVRHRAWARSSHRILLVQGDSRRFPHCRPHLRSLRCHRGSVLHPGRVRQGRVRQGRVLRGTVRARRPGRLVHPRTRSCRTPARIASKRCRAQESTNTLRGNPRRWSKAWCSSRRLSPCPSGTSRSSPHNRRRPRRARIGHRRRERRALGLPLVPGRTRWKRRRAWAVRRPRAFRGRRRCRQPGSKATRVSSSQ
jgi:hypothetical protein